MKIAVYGVGGVGGYFGAKLVMNPENEVHFIARGEHAESIREHGLTIKMPDHDFVVRPASTTSDAGTIGVCDLILVCVKNWQLDALKDPLHSLIGKDTMILPLLNGISAMDILAKQVGGDHVLGGLCRIVAKVGDPGVIEVSGLKPTIVFGELNGVKSERVKQLQHNFEASGVAVEVPEDIMLAVWKKFMFITSLSGVGAYFKEAVGVLRKEKKSRDMLEKSLQEIQQLAEAKGIGLTDEHVEKTLSFIDSLDADVTASMQRDIMAGRPSELEGQTSAIVKLAAECGISVPVHQFIYDALLPLENKARKTD